MKVLKIENFLRVIKERKERIKLAKKEKKSHLLEGNILSKILHPNKQIAIIKEITDLNDNMRSIKFERKGEDKYFAPFQAGQYISVKYEKDGIITKRPYSICSSPKNLLELEICIQKVENGFTSNIAHNDFKVGDEVELSEPHGFFYPEIIRDKKDIVGIAGGSGITPFLSIARAIFEKAIDFNLTLFYGVRKKKDIIHFNEFEKMMKENENIKVIYVLSDELDNSFEHGFISEAILHKYLKNKLYSFFICGPNALYKHMKNELLKLCDKIRHVRYEVSGEKVLIDNYEDCPNNLKENVNIKVKILDEIKTIQANPRLTILRNLENNGIACVNSCRSGECGLCHSYLLDGEVFTPRENDHLRKADKIYNQIHVCSCFALSDITIQIPKL